MDHAIISYCQPKRITWKPNELLRCPLCAWQVQWRVYQLAANRTSGQLTGGRAYPAFLEYLHGYPACRTAKEKILEIDKLIHQFHGCLRGEMHEPKGDRTACVNLLEGTATDILQALDTLAYAEHSTPGLLETRCWWNGAKR